jgi:hypothetical protein
VVPFPIHLKEPQLSTRFSDDYWPFAEPRKDLWFRFNCLACLVSVAWRETAGNHQAKSAWPLPGPFSPFPGNAG